MEIPKEVMQHFNEFNAAAEKWLKRMSALELTPLETRFVADLSAMYGATQSYVANGVFNDIMFLQQCVMSTKFCKAVMQGDAEFYEHYFDKNDELIGGKIEEDYLNYRNADGRLPIEWRNDTVALRFKQGLDSGGG